VWATVDGVTQYRQMTDGQGGMSQNFQMAHFGLGDETQVDQLTIRWPNGSQTVLQNVAADQQLLVTQ
jgi:hypothetical protein